MDVPRFSSLSSSLQRFLAGTSGAISVGFIILLPGLLLIAGIAVDFAILNAQRKFVQSQADMAALTGIRNLSSRQDVLDTASETILSEVFFDMRAPRHDDILFGRFENYDFVANADQNSLENVSAIWVRTASPADLVVLDRFFTDTTPVIRRAAIAQAKPAVDFTLSNCLASLNLLNGMLQPILGAQLDVLCSGHGVRINAAELLERIAINAEAASPDTTYGDILDMELTLDEVLREALIPEGFGIGTGPLSGEALSLGSFLYLSEGLRDLKVTSPLPPLQLNVADLVFGSAEVLGERIVDLELTADLGSAGEVPLSLQISEPRQVVLGAIPGDEDAVARTAQIRLEADAIRLLNLLDVGLALDVAAAEARLSGDGEHCIGDPELRAAVFTPTRSSLLELDIDVSVLGVSLTGLLPRVTQLLSVVGVEEEVTFTHEEVDAQETKTLEVSAGDLVDNAVAMVSRRLALLVPNAGSLVDAVLQDLLGLHLAEAHLEVTGISCSTKLAG